MLPELEQAITTIGFPIAITVYLLYRDHKKMDTLIDLVKELKVIVEAKT